jgi:hypothetical protein
VEAIIIIPRDTFYTTDTYIEDLIKKESLKRLGEYIQQSDERNRDLQVSFLQGVSTSKVLTATSK